MRFTHPLIVTLLALTIVAGCTAKHQQASNQKDNVEKSLQQAGYDHVKVDVDQDRKLITLSGTVRAPDQKDQAGQVAQNAAPGMGISNEISIEPVGQEHAARTIESNVDGAIEKNFKAVLISNHLDNQHVHYHATNGVLVLEGKVKDQQTRNQVQKLASTVPDVSQVINKIDVEQRG